MEPEHLSRWYGDLSDDLRLGGTYRAHLHASGWEGTGCIEACEPLRRLAISSRGDEAAFGARIDVALVASDGHTDVRVEQRGVPFDLLWAFGAGLHLHVEDLRCHVEGLGPDARLRSPQESGALFDALEPDYQRQAAALRPLAK